MEGESELDPGHAKNWEKRDQGDYRKPNYFGSETFVGRWEMRRPLLGKAHTKSVRHKESILHLYENKGGTTPKPAG